MQELCTPVVASGYKTNNLKLSYPVLAHLRFGEGCAAWPWLPWISSLGAVLWWSRVDNSHLWTTSKKEEQTNQAYPRQFLKIREKQLSWSSSSKNLKRKWKPSGRVEENICYVLNRQRPNIQRTQRTPTNQKEQSKPTDGPKIWGT